MFSLFGARKGQGAIEYLLIIGAAILIAAIVVTILINTTKKTEGSVEQAYGDFNKVVTSANIAESIDVTGSAGTAQSADSGTSGTSDCDDACIIDKLSKCEPAKHKHTDTNEGYDIEIYGLDPEDSNFCKVHLVYHSGINGNPDFEGKDMICWLEYKNIKSKELFEVALVMIAFSKSSDKKPKCEGDFFDSLKDLE